MKKRLENAYIRGVKVYVDYTLSVAQAKELAAAGIFAEPRRYRLATDKNATAAGLKWVNENAYAVLKSILSCAVCEDNDEFSVAVYGIKSLEIGSAFRKEKTIKDYAGAFKNYIVPFFGKKRVDEIKASDLGIWQKKLLDKGLSASRVRNIRATFHTILADAERDGMISKNPFDGLKAPVVPEPVIEVYSIEEVQSILANCDGWLHNMVKMQCFSGMRTGEMMALEWTDINFESKTIRVSKSLTHGVVGTTKTGVTGFIDMLPPVEEALRSQYRLTGLRGKSVFVSPKTNEAWKQSKNITDVYWKPLIKRCGLHYIDFYNTRHTFATIMFSNGEDIGWVSKIMLRHKDIKTTLKHYAAYINAPKLERAKFLKTYSFDTAFGTNLAQAKKRTNLKKGEVA